MNNSAYERVLEQYNRFPMPIRTREDDINGAWRRPGDNEYLIRNLIFNGRDIFSENPRILIAGGGTGDSTIFFAKYLKDHNLEGTIIHLDQSSLANKHCAERISNLGLENVVIWEINLFDLNEQEHGLFDFINCNGVLHHLDDPLLGLQTLASVTKPTGGLGIWVYAKYGRAGLYHLQELMLRFFGHETITTELINSTKELIRLLPESSLGRFDPVNHLGFLSQSNITTPDFNGEQLVDRYLNPSDKPLSSGQLFDFIEQAGLHFAGFQHVEAPIYDARNFKLPVLLKSKISELNFPQIAEFAERFHCMINMHRVYLSKRSPGSLLAPKKILRKCHDLPIRKSLSSIINHPYYNQVGGLEVEFNRRLLDFVDALDGERSNEELAYTLGVHLSAIEKSEAVLRSFMPFGVIDTVKPG